MSLISLLAYVDQAFQHLALSLIIYGPLLEGSATKETICRARVVDRIQHFHFSHLVISDTDIPFLNWI